jgi:fucose permease
MEMSLTQGQEEQQPKVSTWLPMVLAGAMFFILGCITWLNGAITPFFTANARAYAITSLVHYFIFLYCGNDNGYSFGNAN